MEEFVRNLKKNELAFESFWKELEVKLSDDIDATRHFLNKDLNAGAANSDPQNPNENPYSGESDVGRRQNELDVSTSHEGILMETLGRTGHRPRKSSNGGARYAPSSSDQPRSSQ